MNSKKCSKKIIMVSSLSSLSSMLRLLFIVHVSVLVVQVVEIKIMGITAFVAFSSSSSSSRSSSRSFLQRTTILFATENNNNNNNKGKGFATENKEKKLSASKSTTSTTTSSTSTSSSLYPSLRRDEVQAFLDTVPVYAVTEPNQEGLVLVKEKNNPNDIAYFFFSPQSANEVFTPLRKKKKSNIDKVAAGDSTEADEWNVSAYPLGLVWFELINEEPEQNEDGTGGVEYRLLPAPDDLIGAQNLLREQAKQQGKSSATTTTSNNVDSNTELFRAPYNEVPIFVDQFLRVTTSAEAAAAAAGTTNSNNKQEEKVPMYIGLKDLMETCNQAIKASSGSNNGDYQAAMSVISLKDLIDEMMAPNGNTNDYRKAILVQPSLPSSSSSSSQQKEDPADAADTFTWEGKQDDAYGKNLDKDEGLLSIPTATNDWSD